MKISLPKALRYIFLLLAAGTSVVLLLNLTAYFGISSSGPFLRGSVNAQHGNAQPTILALPNAQGDLKIFDFADQKLVLLDFAATQSLLQVRHLAYLLFQNLTWGLAIFVLYQMALIFQNLDRQEPFREENTRRIRWIAMAVLFYPFVGLESELLFKSIVSGLPGHGLQLLSGSFVSEKILLGGLLSLVIFGLAEVFRLGHNLQQEQDLTI